jgi:hypothetical protein
MGNAQAVAQSIHLHAYQHPCAPRTNKTPSPQKSPTEPTEHLPGDPEPDPDNMHMGELFYDVPFGNSDPAAASVNHPDAGDADDDSICDWISDMMLPPH